MELTTREKKLLTALNECKLHNWEFYPHYKEFLEDFFSFEGLDLKEKIDKFVKQGLLEVKDLGDGQVICKHTDKVTEEMLDWELSYYGNSHVDGHD